MPPVPTEERPLILGSASPRRREILASLGVPHVVFVASVDEDVVPGEAPDDYLVRVVRAKLAAVRASLPPELRRSASAVLVADTSVILPGARGGSILGKPADVADAGGMIERLGGATHEVHTRFALASPEDGAFLHEETVRTRVTFRPVDRQAARAYAATGEGLDKAGGYAVQGRASAFVARIDGSYSAVVGLPACEISVALERLALL